jgi:hypothetical protein
LQTNVDLERTSVAKITINGLGRIGRVFLKLALTRPELDIVDGQRTGRSWKHRLPDAVRFSVWSVQRNRVLRFDQPSESHRRWAWILFFQRRDPAKLPWSALNIDVVVEAGTMPDANFVVAGVGVRPATAVAEKADLALDCGIAVNEYLETSAPGMFAAGDVARWPDRRSGERFRVEHWVVAERQGQVTTRNMLEHRERFDAVPFFWSQHYDVTINYVGHPEQWDSVRIDGTLESHDCSITYARGDRRLAVATMSRDRENLQVQLTFEREAEQGR